MYHRCTKILVVHHMPTLQKRGTAWRAIVRKKGLSTKSKTFPTKAMAKEWGERIEREYAGRQARGETEAAEHTLGQLIEWYVSEIGELTPWGRSKAADLARLRSYEIAEERAADLTVRDYVRHAERRRRDGTGPATINNDLIWLRQVLRSARASLGAPVDLQALDDAAHELRQRRIVAKPKERNRRVSADEQNALLEYFESRDERSDIPMADIVRFALATARRQEEITRMRWTDLDKKEGTAWLDDVKHPRHKTGNRRQFRILGEAWEIIERQAKTSKEIFPYNPKSISAAFTRACKLLEFDDLHFHDLRHEATSRLFERGYSIQEVAHFTLHESWATLKRYTHLKPADIKERQAASTK